MAAATDVYLTDNLRVLVGAYGLDAVRDALATLDAEDRPQTAPAIRGYLLDDLATWPAAFRRTLEPEMRDIDSLERARDRLRRLDAGRRRASLGDAGGCSCGCRLNNSFLASHLERLRAAAAAVREAATVRSKRSRRYVLAYEKTSLLEWLWTVGIRRIDRRQLAQHAVDTAKRASEEIEAEIERERDAAERARVRLELGVYQKGPRRGQPLTERDREDALEVLASAASRVASRCARIAELARMVAEDVPRLVREYTGCTRAPAAGIADPFLVPMPGRARGA